MVTVGLVAQLTRDELVQDLREQTHLMKLAAESYDRGEHLEALNLAVRLRVLLHTTCHSFGLLAQLGVIDDLRFLATGPTGLGRDFGGATLAPWRWYPDSDRTPPGNVPMLHEAPQVARQCFLPWWDDNVIATRRRTYARRDVVLSLSNTQGGAHVDPNIALHKAELRRSGISEALLRDHQGQVMSAVNPMIPTVRQIAFEVEVTLHEQLGNLLQ